MCIHIPNCLLIIELEFLKGGCLYVVPDLLPLVLM